MRKKVLSLFLALVLALGLFGCIHAEKENSGLKPKVKIAERAELAEKSEDKKEPLARKEDGLKEKASAEQEKPEEEKKKATLKDEKALREDTGKNLKEAHLAVTAGFGRDVVLDKKISFVPGSTVMEVLKGNARVDTGYGGGFVNGINGIESSKGFPPRDWFYYVNGICAASGAGEKKVMPGDVIWWDYHPWKAGMANTAVIGAYPEPFLNGYNKKPLAVKIVFSPSCREGAEQLKSALEGSGAKGIVLEELGKGVLYPRSCPLLVVGEWEALDKIDYFRGLNQAYVRHGMSFYFGEEGLYLLNYEGKKAKLYREKAAVIGATGDGLGDGNPLWLITGTDAESVAKAVEVFKNPEKIRYMYSAAFVNGEVVRLPLE